MVNSWISHVKAYAKLHHISYKEAMKKARTTYRTDLHHSNIENFDIAVGQQHPQFGGSRNSGYIRKLLATKQQPFLIDKVSFPSKHLIDTYSRENNNQEGVNLSEQPVDNHNHDDDDDHYQPIYEDFNAARPKKKTKRLTAAEKRALLARQQIEEQQEVERQRQIERREQIQEYEALQQQYRDYNRELGRLDHYYKVKFDHLKSHKGIRKVEKERIFALLIKEKKAKQRLIRRKYDDLISYTKHFNLKNSTVYLHLRKGKLKLMV